MSDQTNEDELLVLRSRQGDLEALDSLLKKWQQPLWAYAIRKVGNQDAAYDILQESLISIARTIHRLSEDGAFGAWAYQITRNKSLDWLRKNSSRLQREIDFAQEESVRVNGAGASAGNEWVDLLTSIKDPQERTLLRMHFESGFTQQEIASMLGVPLGTVKSRMHTVIAKLRSKTKRNYE